MSYSTLCYADDTLLIVRGPSFEEALLRAELGAAVLVEAMSQIEGVVRYDGGRCFYK